MSQIKNSQIFGLENKSLITNYGLLITDFSEPLLVFEAGAPSEGGGGGGGYNEVVKQSHTETYKTGKYEVPEDLLSRITNITSATELTITGHADKNWKSVTAENSTGNISNKKLNEYWVQCPSGIIDGLTGETTLGEAITKIQAISELSSFTVTINTNGDNSNEVKKILNTILAYARAKTLANNIGSSGKTITIKIDINQTKGISIESAVNKSKSKDKNEDNKKEGEKTGKKLEKVEKELAIEGIERSQAFKRFYDSANEAGFDIKFEAHKDKELKDKKTIILVSKTTGEEIDISNWEINNCGDITSSSFAKIYEKLGSNPKKREATFLNLQKLYQEFEQEKAVIKRKTSKELVQQIETLLNDNTKKKNFTNEEIAQLQAYVKFQSGDLQTNATNVLKLNQEIDNILQAYSGNIELIEARADKLYTERKKHEAFLTKPYHYLVGYFKEKKVVEKEKSVEQKQEAIAQLQVIARTYVEIKNGIITKKTEGNFEIDAEWNTTQNKLIKDIKGDAADNFTDIFGGGFFDNGDFDKLFDRMIQREQIRVDTNKFLKTNNEQGKQVGGFMDKNKLVDFLATKDGQGKALNKQLSEIGINESQMAGLYFAGNLQNDPDLSKFRNHVKTKGLTEEEKNRYEYLKGSIDEGKLKNNTLPEAAKKLVGRDFSISDMPDWAIAMSVISLGLLGFKHTTVAIAIGLGLPAVMYAGGFSDLDDVTNWIKDQVQKPISPKASWEAIDIEEYKITSIDELKRFNEKDLKILHLFSSMGITLGDIKTYINDKPGGIMSLESKLGGIQGKNGLLDNLKQRLKLNHQEDLAHNITGPDVDNMLYKMLIYRSANSTQAEREDIYNTKDSEIKDPGTKHFRPNAKLGWELLQKDQDKNMSLASYNEVYLKGSEATQKARFVGKGVDWIKEGFMGTLRWTRDKVQEVGLEDWFKDKIWDGSGTKKGELQTWWNDVRIFRYKKDENGNDEYTIFNKKGDNMIGTFVRGTGGTIETVYMWGANEGRKIVGFGVTELPYVWEVMKRPLYFECARDFKDKYGSSMLKYSVFTKVNQEFFGSSSRSNPFYQHEDGTIAFNSGLEAVIYTKHVIDAIPENTNLETWLKENINPGESNKLYNKVLGDLGFGQGKDNGKWTKGGKELKDFKIGDGDNAISTDDLTKALLTGNAQRDYENTENKKNFASIHNRLREGGGLAKLRTFEDSTKIKDERLKERQNKLSSIKREFNGLDLYLTTFADSTLVNSSPYNDDVQKVNEIIHSLDTFNINRALGYIKAVADIDDSSINTEKTALNGIITNANNESDITKRIQYLSSQKNTIKNANTKILEKTKSGKKESAFANSIGRIQGFLSDTNNSTEANLNNNIGAIKKELAKIEKGGNKYEKINVANNAINNFKNSFERILREHIKQKLEIEKLDTITKSGADVQIFNQTNGNINLYKDASALEAQIIKLLNENQDMNVEDFVKIYFNEPMLHDYYKGSDKTVAEAVADNSLPYALAALESGDCLSIFTTAKQKGGSLLDAIRTNSGIAWEAAKQKANKYINCLTSKVPEINLCKRFGPKEELDRLYGLSREGLKPDWQNDTSLPNDGDYTNLDVDALIPALLMSNGNLKDNYDKVKKFLDKTEKESPIKQKDILDTINLPNQIAKYGKMEGGGEINDGQIKTFVNKLKDNEPIDVMKIILFESNRSGKNIFEVPKEEGIEKYFRDRLSMLPPIPQELKNLIITNIHSVRHKYPDSIAQIEKQFPNIDLNTIDAIHPDLASIILGVTKEQGTNKDNFKDRVNKAIKEKQEYKKSVEQNNENIINLIAQEIASANIIVLAAPLTGFGDDSKYPIETDDVKKYLQGKEIVDYSALHNYVLQNIDKVKEHSPYRAKKKLGKEDFGKGDKKEEILKQILGL